MANIDEQIIERFQEVLDLSLNESRVYYVLLQKPEASIVEIAEMSELPRSRIYSTLSKLAAKDMVAKNQYGSGYRLIPPQESVSQMIDQVNEQAERRKDSLDRLGSFLNDMWQNNLVDEAAVGVKLIPGHSIEPFIIESIKEMRSRMLIAVATENPIIDWRNTARILSENLSEELDVRYLVPNKQMVEQLTRSLTLMGGKLSDNIEVSHSQEVHISFIITDSTSYLFIFSTDSLLEPIVLRSVSSQLTKALEWMFNRLWIKKE